MKIDESPSYQSLTAALGKEKALVPLFIYDNSPQAQNLKIDQCWNPAYSHDPFNAGVSKAYNEGFKMAKEWNKKWLMLADQDTFFPVDIFDEYQNAIALHPGQELFSPIVRSKATVVSPFRFVWGRGSAISTVRSGLYSISDYKFINSGLLVSTNLFGKCGGYDDRFRLDFSDLVFAERAQEVVSEFVVINAECSHSLSSHENSFEVAINRFALFTKASKAYGQMRGWSITLFVSRLLRSVKLSFRFRSLAFLKLIIQ